MTQVVVTVKTHDGKMQDLSVPWEVATEGIIEGLVEALELPRDRDYEILHIQKHISSKISSYVSLAQAGVIMGDVLELVPIVQAFLSTEDGLEFLIKTPLSVVGRSVPDAPVDIDFTDIDEPKLVSRKHATIETIDGKYYIVDTESLNGILVNEIEIEAGSRIKLEVGDKIHFGGKQGIWLTFKFEL